jgi:ABC-type transport system involved in multi-copper enzyme maturation permease subunit
MLNILRSDFYRIRHSKSIYVIAAVLVLLLVFLHLLAAVNVVSTDEPNFAASEGAATDSSSDTGWTLSVESNYETGTGAINGIRAPFIFMSQANVLMYFILALVYAVVIADFSSGALKNALASGVSRSKLYMTRLVESSLLTIAFFLLSIVVCVVVYTAVLGFGGTVTVPYLLSILRPFAAQCVLFVGAAAIGTAIGFISKRGAVLNGLYLALYLGAPMAFYLLSEHIAGWFITLDFDANLELLSMIDILPLADTLRALGIGVGCIVVSTILGLSFFKRSEIK